MKRMLEKLAQKAQVYSSLDLFDYTIFNVYSTNWNKTQNTCVCVQGLEYSTSKRGKEGERRKKERKDELEKKKWWNGEKWRARKNKRFRVNTTKRGRDKNK